MFLQLWLGVALFVTYLFHTVTLLHICFTQSHCYISVSHTVTLLHICFTHSHTVTYLFHTQSHCYISVSHTVTLLHICFTHSHTVTYLFHTQSHCYISVSHTVTLLHICFTHSHTYDIHKNFSIKPLPLHTRPLSYVSDQVGQCLLSQTSSIATCDSTLGGLPSGLGVLRSCPVCAKIIFTRVN